MAEAESTPVESEPLPQEVSCVGVKSHGPCFEKVSTGGSNDPSFQAANNDATSSSSGVVAQGSRPDFMQLGDAKGLPVLTSSLNSSASGSRSTLVQNLQPVVTNKSAEYEPSTPRIVSYGSVYRLLKPHGAYSSSRTVPSASFIPPISSSVTTSKVVPNGQNGNMAGFSQSSNDATPQGDTFHFLAATYYARNKPPLSSMISSGPIITFIMPNQSDYQHAQPINKAQSGYEPNAHIKPLVTIDHPTAGSSKHFEHSQGMNYQRPTSQPQVANEIGWPSPQTNNNKPIVPKPHLKSKNPSISQSRTTEPRFTQLVNAYSSADTTNKPVSAFTLAQTTSSNHQISKPVQRSQQLADFPQEVYDSSSTAVPLSGSVFRFTRPGHVHGTSVSTGTSMYVPPSSAKTEQSNYIQHFYQSGISYPKVGYGSPSSAVDSGYGFAQLGNAYGLAENTYTSNSQPTSSHANLSQNPYFIARQGQNSYSTFKPPQPNYNSFPTTYMQMPSKSFNTPFSQKDSVQDSEQLHQMWNRMSEVKSVTSEGFQTWHHYGSILNSEPVQNGDQGKHPQKPIQSCTYKPKNLFDYLSSLYVPAEQSVSSNFNQLQTGQSTGQSESVNLTNYNPIQRTHSTSKAIQGYYSPAPFHLSQGSVGLSRLRSIFDPVSSGHVVNQTSNQSGVLVNPSQQFFRLESRPVSSENSYGPSQPDSGFALKGSRPVLNFQKGSFTRPFQSVQGFFQ